MLLQKFALQLVQKPNISCESRASTSGDQAVNAVHLSCHKADLWSCRQFRDYRLASFVK